MSETTSSSSIKKTIDLRRETTFQEEYNSILYRIQHQNGYHLEVPIYDSFDYKGVLCQRLADKFNSLNDGQTKIKAVCKNEKYLNIDIN